MTDKLLINWLEADKKIAAIKTDMAALAEKLRWAEKEAEDAALAIKEEMLSTGEYEINIAGEFCDYKIYFTAPRESVKVENPDAVPDEFCKIERRPKLKEIKEELDRLKESGAALPNWATVQLGESKLSYKVCKK